LENKILTKTAVLIATFLLAMPLTIPAFATPTANVSITPGSINTDVGGSFTINVMVSNAQNLAGFDLKINYDPRVLTATSGSLTGTLFDPAKNNVLIARADIIQAIGRIRYALAIIGGSTVTPSPSASLLSVNFNANDPSSSPFDSASLYPASIVMTSIELVSLQGGQTTLVPTQTTDATYMPAGDVALRNVGCRAVNNGFNTNAKGFTDPLFCRVVNNGAQSITVRGDFNYASLGGLSGSLSGPSMTLAPGQAAEVDSALTVAPHTNDVFFVTGQGTRLITFQDGSVLAIQSDPNPAQGLAGSVVFQVTVTSPF